MGITQSVAFVTVFFYFASVLLGLTPAAAWIRMSALFIASDQKSILFMVE